jgi:hypothetical protein
MTSVTSSFRDGEGCPETWGGGVEVPGLEVVNETSQKLILGTNDCYDSEALKMVATI